jgi:TPR repeat protein
MGVWVGFIARAALWAVGVVTVSSGLVRAAVAGPPTDDRGGHQITSKQFDEVLKKAEKGFPDAQYRLAEAYLLGEGVAQDLEKAALWYEKAARRGHPEAQNQIGYLYQRGIGVRADAVRAFHWYQLASASGLGWGKLNLGVAYLQGTGVAKNAPEARQLLKEALDKGVGLAATYLGHMDYFGMGAPVDKAAAEKWFEQGVKLHDPMAACDLALLYSNEDGHPRSLRRAAELFRYSSRRGYVLAKHALGRLLVNEPELAETDQEARTVLEEASAAGEWKSSAVLGVLARDGRYMPADASRAYYWFRLSELQGGDAAKQAVRPDVDALSRKLSDAARTAAAKEAADWFAQHPKPMMILSMANQDDRNLRFRAVVDASGKLVDGE